MHNFVPSLFLTAYLSVRHWPAGKYSYSSRRRLQEAAITEDRGDPEESKNHHGQTQGPNITTIAI